VKIAPTVADDLKATMPRRPSLFWDTDPSRIDPERHSRYVIERIMDFGTDEEVRWMWRACSRDELRRVARLLRGIDCRSKPLWTALTA
jgi:hypothetical protein